MQETVQVVETVEQAATNVPQGSSLGLWLYFIVVFAIIYFLMVRPNKKRMAEYQKMLDSLKPGNRVMAAGIYGTIKKVNEKSIDVEIAKGVVVEINKNAVASVE